SRCRIESCESGRGTGASVPEESRGWRGSEARSRLRGLLGGPHLRRALEPEVGGVGSGIEEHRQPTPSTRAAATHRGHCRENSRTRKTGGNSTSRRIRRKSGDCWKQCDRTRRSLAEVFLTLTLPHLICWCAATKQEHGGPSGTTFATI